MAIKSKNGINALIPFRFTRLVHKTKPRGIAPLNRLYLRNTQSTGITSDGVACYDMLTTEGVATDTLVVNTTLTGTEIQFTKTAGGAVASFIGGRADVGGYTLKNTDISLWALESLDLVNAGLRFRLFIRNSAGVETEVGGSPFNKGVELTTDIANYQWQGAVTSTFVPEDSRPLLKLYVVNEGVMAMGTATLRFNGAVGQKPVISASYVNEVLDLNLTNLGAEDAVSYDASGNIIRKTGGGSLFTVQPYNYNSSSNDVLDGFTGFGGTGYKVTTTDFNTNITNKADASYVQTANKGFKITVPAGIGLRTLKLYLVRSWTTDAIGTIAFTLSDGSAAYPTIRVDNAGGVDKDFTVTVQYAAASASQTLVIDYVPIIGTTVFTGFRGGWISTEGAAPSQADSYLNVYPAVTFKAEGGGVFVIDLTLASLKITAQTIQNRLTITLTNALLKLTAQTIQLRHSVALTAAQLKLVAQSIQNRLATTLTAAQLKLTAQAVQLRLILTMTAAQLKLTAQSIQNRLAVTLTAAQLKLVAQAIDVVQGAAIVYIALEAAVMSMVPKSIQLRLSMSLTAAQNKLTAQAISARLTISLTAAQLKLTAQSIQNRLTIGLTKANLFLIAQAVDLVATIIQVVRVGQTLSVTRFRRILRRFQK